MIVILADAVDYVVIVGIELAVLIRDLFAGRAIQPRQQPSPHKPMAIRRGRRRWTLHPPAARYN
jgi:hypothetical protein